MRAVTATPTHDMCRARYASGAMAETCPLLQETHMMRSPAETMDASRASHIALQHTLVNLAVLAADTKQAYWE
jgi:hypothetical protein